MTWTMNNEQINVNKDMVNDVIKRGDEVQNEQIANRSK